MALQEYPAPESVSRLQTRALSVGSIALLLAIFGAMRSPGAFYQSYLMGHHYPAPVGIGYAHASPHRHLLCSYRPLRHEIPLRRVARP